NAVSSHLDNGRLRYGVDPFVAKFDPTGSKLIYATYLGGSGNDWANALAVDGDGNAYVAGDVGPVDAFPGPNGAGLKTPSQYDQAFVVKLSPSGIVVYTKFIDQMTPRGIAVDSSGAVYLAAGGNVGTFIFSGLSVQNRRDGDVVVVKLAADGSGPIWQSR